MAQHRPSLEAVGQEGVKNVTRIQSACLEQTILFEMAEEFEQYKARLERKKIPFKVIEEQPQANGTLIVKLKKRYVNYDPGDYLK